MIAKKHETQASQTHIHTTIWKSFGYQRNAQKIIQENNYTNSVKIKKKKQINICWQDLSNPKKNN